MVTMDAMELYLLVYPIVALLVAHNSLIMPYIFNNSMHARVKFVVAIFCAIDSIHNKPKDSNSAELFNSCL